MSSVRFLIRYRTSRHAFHSISILSSSSSHKYRSISSTCHLGSGWMDKIKGVFTGKKAPSEPQPPASPESFTGKKAPSEPQPPASPESFTLLRHADEMKTAIMAGILKKFIVVRSSEATSSEATSADAFEKREAIIRYLGALDATGENLQSSQKQSAAQHCNCTIADVEFALEKFTRAREVHKFIQKLKNQDEVQKLMGSTLLDVVRTNLAKSGQISRNAPCPCGSKKKYKWCCGKSDKK